MRAPALDLGDGGAGCGDGPNRRFWSGAGAAEVFRKLVDAGDALLGERPIWNCAGAGVTKALERCPGRRSGAAAEQHEDGVVLSVPPPCDKWRLLRHSPIAGFSLYMFLTNGVFSKLSRRKSGWGCISSGD